MGQLHPGALSGRAELLATLKAKALAGAPAPSAGRLAIVEELKTKYCQALAQGALPQPSTTGGASPRPAPEDAVSRMEVETSAGGTKRQGNEAGGPPTKKSKFEKE